MIVRFWENPLFSREATQRTRLLWTPLSLLAITILLTLLMSSVGGLMLASKSRPAQIGLALFHTFFSVAFFVVTVAGAAVAANSVASERDGKTWEPLVLTGIKTRDVALGKLASALSSIGTYIAMIAPVGAMSFLFGGVTAVEVALAYAWLSIFGVLAVAFGLALSSVMTSGRGAVVVTLLVTFFLTPMIYGGGLALGGLVHDAVKEVDFAPAWLPTAYDRMPFGWEYVSWLILVPVAVSATIFWYLFEVARANLADPNDDRSSGLRLWFLVSGTLLALALASVVGSVAGSSASVPVALFAVIAYFLFLLFVAFTFVGEPVLLSRRVRRRMKEPGGPKGVLAPGLLSGALMTLFIGVLGLTAVLVTLAIIEAKTVLGPRHVAAVGLVAGNGAGFVAFLLGLGALLRARGSTSFSTRLLLVVALFFAFVGPWVVTAVGWAAMKEITVACPSPIFAVVAAVDLVKSYGPPEPKLGVAAAVAGAGWLLVGATLFVAAARKVKEEGEKARRAEWELDKRMNEERAPAPTATAEPAPEVDPG